MDYKKGGKQKEYYSESEAMLRNCPLCGSKDCNNICIERAYVGYYYQYPSPWFLDWKNYTMRSLFYWISKVERVLRFGNIGYFAPNIIVAAEKK